MKHNPETFYNSSCRDVAFDDYLLLGGGSDISPKLYGQKNHGLSQGASHDRDKRNLSDINRYVEMGKPIFGICRGLQIMDAAFGGELIQHTVGHSSLVSINIEGQKVYDNCRSCHHQMSDVNSTQGDLIGWSEYPVKCFFDDKEPEMRNLVPQIIYWPDKKALAVQFHPEWQGESHSMNNYLRGLIKDLLGLENVL